MKRKLFLITEFYDSAQNTTGYLLGKLYKCFDNQEDLDVTLITKKDPDIANQPDAIYVKGLKINKKRLINRAYYELLIGLKFFVNSANKVKSKDIVFTGTTPILLLIPISVLKKLIGFRWILLVHDVFPENLVPAKVLTMDNLVYKLLKKVFDGIYASADSIIVIGVDMKQLIHKKTKSKNIFVVPNWIDEADISVESKSDNAILRELNWNNGKVTFQFFGNIGRVQGISNLIKAIELMSNSDRAQFLFIGDGAYSDELKQLIAGYENIIYYGAVPQIDKSIGLNACDISIVTLAEGMLGLGVPSKAYYSMAANKPIFAIMDKRSETYQMVQQNNIGWVVEPYNIEEVAKKLDEAVETIHTKVLNSPRKTLINKYSEKIAMGKILDVIKLL
ncbi:glycosyltransferase family 4 protein [Psychrobacter sp.]|uniref:glycosyltransferase family 4 protein n=1 Tax=Psychrobacter sp. TaxID=56811 RepID=UPI0025CF741B|nr:glycosyltransferase family 4 protein [Psychrobacter sp.]